ncbi:MAG: MbcA/ParS/Xre antitoxin family protein [Pseudomonadota bacterium]
MTLQSIPTGEREFVPTPITDAEAAAMLRAVLNLFGKWRITDDEGAVLLDMPLRTFRRWKTGQPGRFDRDTKARLSNLLGIHKALRVVFSDQARVFEWVKAPNTVFGASALTVMLRGELTDIMRVRRYLDAERGAW